MQENKQQLVVSIIEFLKHCIDDGSIEGDGAESLNVAIQCIGEAFHVDPENEEQIKSLSVNPASLQSIFDVFLETRNKKKKEAPNGDQVQAADALKNEGNKKLVLKEYDEAIRLYSEAIRLNPSAVYYANRAAAYSQSGKHDLAIEDCNEAIKLDASYSKAYSRLGLAYFSLAQYEEAVTSYKKALELDPDNTTSKQSLQAAEQKLSSTAATRAPGGMPDLGSMLNNPALMNMASQVMQNPEMANMAQSLLGGEGNGGGLANLLNNPQLMNMAQQMMQNPQMADLMRGFTQNGGNRP